MKQSLYVPKNTKQNSLISLIDSRFTTNGTYVDLTTNQTVAGVKNFSSAPVISSIKNTGTLTLPTSTDTLVGRATSDTLSNKTLATTVFNGRIYANAQNLGAIGSQTNYISMYDNPIFLRAQSAAGDMNHYLMYGGVSGQSFAGQSKDGPALVGFDGGILGASNGNTWALKWNSSSNINLNGQCFADTSNASGFPWLTPRYSFNNYSNCGLYFATDSSTYKTVGTSINGKYISYTGINPTSGAASFIVANADATIMGGFYATSGTGAGYFEANGYIAVNGSSSQTYSYGYLNSAGATGTSSATSSYSIIAAQRIKATEFNAVSSKKIKTIQSSLNDSNTMTEAINLFKSIPLSKYIYVDSQQHDSYTHYGLIAEDMPNGLYTDSSQSGYVPNIYKMGIIDSVDEKGIGGITLNSAISADKLSTITNMEYVLCYGSEDEGKTYSKFEVIENLTIIDDTHITAYLPDYKEYSHTGLTLLVYGTQEIIPNIAKNPVFEIGLCVIKNLLERIEELEKKIS